jgi:hypothetical protein
MILFFLGQAFPIQMGIRFPAALIAAFLGCFAAVILLFFLVLQGMAKGLIARWVVRVQEEIKKLPTPTPDPVPVPTTSDAARPAPGRID